MAPTETLYGGRVVNHGLQTAVQEHRHPNGRVVTIVGCVHVAEPEYFQRIREVVDKLEANGATVYMEGVGQATTEALWSEMPEEVRNAAEAQNAALHIQYTGLPDLFEVPWIYQGDDKSALFPYPETWRSSDCNKLDMFYLLGPEAMAEVAPLAKHFEHYKRLKEKDPYGLAFTVARQKYWARYIEVFRVHGRAIRLAVKFVGRLAFAKRKLARLLTRKPLPKGNVWMNPFVNTYRECVGAITALKDGGDVVLLSHPGHAIALGQILYRHGFVPQEPTWLEATHALAHLEKPKKPKKAAKAEKAEARGADATP